MSGRGGVLRSAGRALRTKRKRKSATKKADSIPVINDDALPEPKMSMSANVSGGRKRVLTDQGKNPTHHQRMLKGDGTFEHSPKHSS